MTQELKEHPIEAMGNVLDRAANYLRNAAGVVEHLAQNLDESMLFPTYQERRKVLVLAMLDTEIAMAQLKETDYAMKMQ